jgi:predicted PurR-regulated permease PerM
MMSLGGWLSLTYLIIFLFLSHFAPYVMGALILGFFLSLLINVPTNLFSKKMNSNVASVLSHLLVLGAFFYAAISFFPLVINEGKKLFSVLSTFAFPNTGEMDNLPTWILDVLDEFSKNISSFGINLINKLISVTPSLLMSTIVLIVTTIAIGSLKSLMKDNSWKLYPVNERDKGVKFLKSFYGEVEKFVHGRFLSATIVGFVIGIATYVAGIPNSLFIGIVAWIGDFIPYLGSIAAGILLAILGFTEKGLPGLIIGLLIALISNQIEMWFLYPKIQSKVLNLHWFIVLIASLLFGELFGFIGVLIALPLVIYVINFWEYWVVRIK